MARFSENPDFVQACREDKRKVDLRVWIDWFGDGQIEEIEGADNEILKLNISRELEGDVSQAILDQGTLVLDNSNNDYSPKSLASRFNVDLGSEYEFNLIPNRSVMVDLSVNDSDYVHYYNGIITNIEPNHDNSRVSITIEDEMLALDNMSAPDTLFIERNAKEVIAELLEGTAIDYDPTMVDDIDYQITYNFSQDGSVFNALKLIAEMVWGKFFVIESKLRFINFKTLNQPSDTIVETISDMQFLENGYGETFSSQDLYTKVELESNPLQYTTDDLQMIWTGSEKQSRVTEEYLGSDLEGDQLQLTHTIEGTIEESTNNVPIAENSLVVSFGDKTYITNYGMTSGIESVNWDTGLITFKNTEEFPAPSTNQIITVNYNYFILTIPPRSAGGDTNEKEIFIEYDNPSTDIQSIGDYVKFQATNLDYDVTYASYRESWGGIQHNDGGGSGTVTKWTQEFPLSSNAQTVRISGKFWINSSDYKWWGSSNDYKNATMYLDLFINGENQGRIGSITGTHRATRNFSKKFPVPPGSTAQIRYTFIRSGEHKNQGRVYNLTANVGERITDEVTQEVQNVRVEQIDYPDNRRTKLTFINDSDTEVSVYSEYKGKDVDNIYLLGRPLTRPKPMHSEKTNEDANASFSYMGKTLSLQNDLFQSELRMNETVDFLVDYYSTPRTVLSVPIKGLGHIDLMDKVHITREEADIDNDFFIRAIEEEFTEDGEWLQTLDLFQSAKSTWSYDSEGVNSIITSKESIDTTPSDRPPSVSNLTLEVVPIDTDEGSYPAIKVSYDSNRLTRFHNIFLQREEGNPWEKITRTTESEFIFESVFNRGIYNIKVVSENYEGILELFGSAPVESISYTGAGVIESTDITLRELSRKVQKGTYVPVIEVRVDSYLDEYFNEIKMYIKHEDSNEWRLSATTSNLLYEILAPELGYYEIKVIPVDKHGNSPDFDLVSSIIFEVTGKTDLPSKVDLESVYWGANYIEFNWIAHPDDDFDEYELRKDDNFGGNY